MKNPIGTKGEALAVAFLKDKGYKIERLNFNTPYGEIDIIAWDRDALAFIEVKTRQSDRYGSPVEAISPTKIKKISKAALMCLKEFKIQPPVRFDVVAITLKKDSHEIELIKDAFEGQI
jgi:putative endonuclease